MSEDASVIPSREPLDQPWPAPSASAPDGVMGTIRGETPRDEAKLLSFTTMQTLRDKGWDEARQHIEDCVCAFLEATRPTPAASAPDGETELLKHYEQPGTADQSIMAALADKYDGSEYWADQLGDSYARDLIVAALRHCSTRPAPAAGEWPSEEQIENGAQKYAEILGFSTYGDLMKQEVRAILLAAIPPAGLAPQMREALEKIAALQCAWAEMSQIARAALSSAPREAQK